MSWAQIAGRILLAFLSHPGTSAAARHAVRLAARAGLRYLAGTKSMKSTNRIS